MVTRDNQIKIQVLSILIIIFSLIMISLQHRFFSPLIAVIIAYLLRSPIQRHNIDLIPFQTYYLINDQS